MRRSIFVSVVCLALLCLPAVAVAGPEEEVIEVTYFQWNAEIAGDSDKAASVLADDYTEFNQAFPTRIDDKALNRRLADAMAEGGGSMLVACGPLWQCGAGACGVGVTGWVPLTLLGLGVLKIRSRRDWTATRALG